MNIHKILVDWPLQDDKYKKQKDFFIHINLEVFSFRDNLIKSRVFENHAIM